MSSGKRQDRTRTIRPIASWRNSAGNSVEGVRSTPSFGSGKRSSERGAKQIFAASPSTVTVPNTTNRKPGLRKLTIATFTGSELLSQLESTLSASDNEIFLFGTFAYDLGIPTAIKLLVNMGKLQAEATKT